MKIPRIIRTFTRLVGRYLSQNVSNALKHSIFHNPISLYTGIASRFSRFTSNILLTKIIIIMRRLLLMLAIPLLVITACSEVTKEEIADVLIISQDNVAFPMEGGTATISVASPSEWHSSVSDKSWLSATDEEGMVVITASANASGSTRKAKVILQSATTRTEIAVSQSWTGAVLSLTVNGPDNIELDSEGESFKFSVETEAQWSVSTSDSWIEVETDGPIVSVTAAANKAEHRNGTITVTATSGDDSKSKVIEVSQISHDENPYFQMLGEFGLFAERWYYGGNAIDVSGIGTYCTIEQKEYGKSFIIKDLFVEGTEIEAAYDKETKKMVLTLGSLCLTKELVMSGQTYYYYLVQPNITEKKFESGILYGTAGTASDGTNDNCPAIMLSGFDAAYGSLGLIVKVLPGGTTAMLSDVYYADGAMYLVKASAK